MNREKYLKYKLYLRTWKWIQKRDFIRWRAGGRCEQCGKRSERIQAHHRTYARLFDELPQDLIGLCGGCHLNTEEEKKKRRGRTPWHRRLNGWAVKVYGKDWKEGCHLFPLYHRHQRRQFFNTGFKPRSSA